MGCARILASSALCVVVVSPSGRCINIRMGWGVQASSKSFGSAARESLNQLMARLHTIVSSNDNNVRVRSSRAAHRPSTTTKQLSVAATTFNNVQNRLLANTRLVSSKAARNKTTPVSGRRARSRARARTAGAKGGDEEPLSGATLLRRELTVDAAGDESDTPRSSQTDGGWGPASG